MPQPSGTRNRWTFAIGTLGRDMVYSLMALFLIVYLTEVLRLPNETLAWVNGILLAARLFDAFTDILMGSIVDNTRSRWGAYKPWILFGAFTSGVITIVLFSDPGQRGWGYIAFFTVVYLLWGLAFTTNDIPYWSLLPALSLDQRERERIGALAKVFATIGLFSTVVGVLPLTNALGGDARAWTVFAAIVVGIMWLGQLVTLLGVREPQLAVPQQPTSLREMVQAVARNDQLLWTAVTMTLFMTGYNTTTTFGVYFFKYAYRDEGMYVPFAAVLGVAQLLGFALYPLIRRRLNRMRTFTLAIGLVALGYVVFYFSPMDIVPIGVAGLLLFVGQAFLVALMLGFFTDCIDYGHWKLGRRNTAVTFALQPFINKVGGALGTAVVGATLIQTGINGAPSVDAVPAGGITVMRLMMMAFPLVLIVMSYLIYRWRYRIDEAFHARIIADLRERGDLVG